MQPHQMPRSSELRQQSGQVPSMASRSASFDRRTRSEDSWVEISSQPSSSSLSSAADEIVTTGLRVEHDPRAKRRRSLRHNPPTNLSTSHRVRSMSGASSQEEYEESESESDRVMTSSGEGLLRQADPYRTNMSPAIQPMSLEPSTVQLSDDDDENRTAINYPIQNDQCFTPQPNAFSHPPSHHRHASQPVAGSYFPPQRRGHQPTTRHSFTGQDTSRQSHLPQNILSPSYNAAAQNDEALRASLSTLLSCAAAARGLSKPQTKQYRSSNSPNAAQPPRASNKVEPLSLRLVPESALPVITTSTTPQFHEPQFKPTLRRDSTATSASSAQNPLATTKENKRKAGATTASSPHNRASSRERRALKKARRSSSSTNETSSDLYISPTLLTWVVSAGVVVFLSALSFSAGYSLGKEAGRFEAGGLVGDEGVRNCAREAGRTSLGLRRSLARSAVQV